MDDSMTRRQIVGVGLTAAIAGAASAADEQKAAAAKFSSRPYLTPSLKFADVSRGNPIPRTLKGEALVKARLTPETWRLEIDVPGADDAAKLEKPLSIAAGTALDLPGLMKLGEANGVRHLKAMQCQNIAFPLGQGLWEGVLLRDVLKRCGKLVDARRFYFWGYHNDKPEQKFQSSLAMNQVFDSAPGELPPFLAYRLNGGPIPLERGGPVRMVVPWAHGFKSIKWLQKIVATSDVRANDTYANDGNDPESHLKTAAYFDDSKPAKFRSGDSIVVRGTAMVGLPGIERVEYWLRHGSTAKLADEDPAWATARWIPGSIDPLPDGWCEGLPKGVRAKDVWGFDANGNPKEWPSRYSIAHWTVSFASPPPGKYELRVRTVDKNGFAQPMPRPGGRTGMNQVQCKLLTIAPVT